MKIDNITDKTKILELIPEVIRLIKITYGDEYYGTLIEKRLQKTTSMIQAVKNDLDKLIAGALCRRFDGTHKVSAFFSDKSEEGKEAVHQIIKKNIQEYSSLVWCEVSGAIEHLYKKYNGYPIPNAFVATILNKPETEIKLSDDGFHYSRIIGESKKEIEKVIFGFPSKEYMDKFIHDQKYLEERKMFNLSKKVLESRNTSDDLAYASSFVEQLSDLTDEKRIIEMSPQLSAVLDESIEVLKKHIGEYDWVQDDYDTATYLREEIPVIRYGTIKEVIDSL